MQVQTMQARTTKAQKRPAPPCAAHAFLPMHRAFRQQALSQLAPRPTMFDNAYVSSSSNTHQKARKSLTQSFAVALESPFNSEQTAVVGRASPTRTH
jgi:predicted outer membrane protein